MPRPDWNKKYVEGKGSWRRPEDTDRFRQNWDRIFKPKDQKDEHETPE